MNLKKVHHIAIIGSNYEKSRRFYVDLLGFSVIRENYRPERDDYKIDLQLDGMELELFRSKDGKIFNEIFRGEKSRKDFFNEILDILTLLGGEVGNVR